MKLYKSTLISFFTAVVTVVFAYGGYSVYVGNAYEFEQSAGDFDDLFDDYHDEMNEFFNAKLEHLVEIVDEDEKFYNNKDFKVPGGLQLGQKGEDTNSILAKCGIYNVSTGCVSMQALDMYMTYVRSLDYVRSTLDSSGESGETVGELLDRTASRNDRVNQEAEEAKKVMEATLAAYEEFRLAYPMHKKYQEIIADLTKYKLSLKDIKNMTLEFPAKFIDATSSQCE